MWRICTWILGLKGSCSIMDGNMGSKGDVVRGGGVMLGLIFAGYVPLASQSPYPILVYSVANHMPHLSYLLVKYVIFAIPA